MLRGLLLGPRGQRDILDTADLLHHAHTILVADETLAPQLAVVRSGHGNAGNAVRSPEEDPRFLLLH